MRQLTGTILYAVIIAFVIWCAFALRADLARMSLAPLLHSWAVVLLAMLLSLLNYAVRIVRWRWYLRRLGHSVAPGFAALTYIAGFAFTLSPGKVGEVARARYYNACGIPMPEVAGAFCVERLMDVIAMLVLATLILTAFPRYGDAIWYAAVVIAFGVGLLAVLPWESLGRRVGSAGRLPPIITRCAAGVTRTASAARALLRPQALLLGLGLGLAAWGFEGLGLFALGSMFTPAHLDPAVGVGIYAVAVILGAVSFLPGGLGSTEAVMTTLLSLRGYSVGDALLITIVCRLVTLWLAVGLGWIAVLALRTRPVSTVVP
jgi:uncharacterized protein (TIRG00374 family)